MFKKFLIPYHLNSFEILSKSIKFEGIGEGRKTAVLVTCEDNSIPIVRTTTKSNYPSQAFLGIHYDLIKIIKETSKMTELSFNNALMEIYAHKYRNMKYHSDQSLDLEEKSYICLFSCYDNAMGNRTLRIKDKTSGSNADLVLEHNSIVVFSLAANSRFLHKIILEKYCKDNKDNHWLGITFRLSKTLIKFVKLVPYICRTGKPLTLATEKETIEFLKEKGKENKEVAHSYSEINYTLSKSDMLPMPMEEN